MIKKRLMGLLSLALLNIAVADTATLVPDDGAGEGSKQFKVSKNISQREPLAGFLDKKNQIFVLDFNYDSSLTPADDIFTVKDGRGNKASAKLELVLTADRIQSGGAGYFAIAYDPTSAGYGYRLVNDAKAVAGRKFYYLVGKDKEAFARIVTGAEIGLTPGQQSFILLREAAANGGH
ncbi:MAG: hypothetical protein K0S08_827 [Gammaproteobacteria bacterium]|jgi:hypothetical protein|nr:hypothetical protein [Gammaproteobacteria bacterium]